MSAGKKTVRDLLILVLAGAIYLCMVRYFHLGIPCYLRTIFHINCPVCGTTRMVMKAARFSFKEAFFYNPYTFISLPYIIYEIIYLLYINESKKKMSKPNRIILYIWTSGLIVFGIIRNLIGI